MFYCLIFKHVNSEPWSYLKKATLLKNVNLLNNNRVTIQIRATFSAIAFLNAGG